MQRSEATRSENASIVGRSTARSTGVHKRAQDSPVDRSVDHGKGTVDRGVTDSHEIALGLSRSTEGQGRSTGPSAEKRIWAQICISFQDSDFVFELETNAIGIS